MEHYRLAKAESHRTALAEQMGADGVHLLSALEQADAPLELRELESVRVLRQVWQQYYDLSNGRAKWRAGPQADEQEGVLRSPYDPEACTGKKRETVWLGYKVHLTETFDADSPETPEVPHLIVQVQTTVANVQDVEVTATIQQELAQADLLPQEQIVDTGYVDAALLVSRKPGLWHQAAGSGLVRQQRAALKRTTASMPPTSRSTGKRVLPRARKGSRVLAGRP